MSASWSDRRTRSRTPWPARVARAALLPFLIAATPPVPDTSSQASAPVPAPAATAPLTMPDMPLHDPWIVADRDGGMYRLYTRNEPSMTGERRVGVMMYTSRDLKTWQRPRLAFVLPPDVWANDGAWAPEVHRWKGRWYMFATFHNEADTLPANGPYRPIRRSTLLAVSDRLDGPFTLVRDGAPIVDASVMTLDGTLYVDRKGRPWTVYAHEWVQIGDGTMEAMPLDDSLAAAGPRQLLFRASDARWAIGAHHANGTTSYVTDGPELFRTKTGTLLMLWSSYDKGGYVQGLARSRSGEIQGPWEQLPPLVRDDSGHGMLFHRFDGTLMMVLHHPFRNARGRLYEMRDDGDTLTVVRQAKELDLGGSPAR